MKYSYTDASPLSGTNFYRLKQIDFDGKFEYSAVRLLIFEGYNLVVYPNPVVNRLTVERLKLGQMLILLNAIGLSATPVQVVTSTKLEIDMSALSGGICYLQIHSKNGAQVTHKIVKL